MGHLCSGARALRAARADSISISSIVLSLAFIVDVIVVVVGVDYLLEYLVSNCKRR